MLLGSDQHGSEIIKANWDAAAMRAMSQRRLQFSRVHGKEIRAALSREGKLAPLVRSNR